MGPRSLATNNKNVKGRSVNTCNEKRCRDALTLSQFVGWSGPEAASESGCPAVRGAIGSSSKACVCPCVRGNLITPPNGFSKMHHSARGYEFL